MSKIDIQALIRETSDGMVARAWAIMLAAIGDFYTTKAEMIIDIWNKANEFAKTVSEFKDIDRELDEVQRTTGVKLPYNSISLSNIKTQGELNKARRKLEQNAISAGLTIIAHPIIKCGAFDDEMIRILFGRVSYYQEEIASGAITFDDIQGSLEDEFGLMLFTEDGRLKLAAVEYDSVEAPDKL